jgi:phosphate transport system substrate-binding protein
MRENHALNATHITRLAAVTAGFLAIAGPMLAAADTNVVGAGSTFDNPFFSRAFYQYKIDHPDVTVDYQSIGSGGGIQQFTARTVDFGASDVPLNPTELKAANDANGPVVEIPVTLGGVAIAYNVPGAPTHMHLTPDVLANIFLGKVSNWNDASIAAVNPGVKLPDLPIVVVHRADGSGTTYIFTDYLSRISADWKSQVGTAKTVSWPAQSSVGMKGNEGVAGQIQQTPGAIGYIELAYALENDIAYAAIQNKDGLFVLPTLDSVRAAAAERPDVSPTSFSIVDQSGAASYPICGYSWVMLWRNQGDPARRKQIVDLFQWVVTSGQDYAVKVKYVALPDNVQKAAEAALDTIHS